MKRKFNYLLALTMPLLFGFCSGTNNPAVRQKIIAFNDESIGLVRGQILYIYNHTDKHNWAHEKGNTFTIPASAKYVFFCDYDIGVLHTTGKVQLYKYMGAGDWIAKEDDGNHKGSYTVAKDVEKVCTGGYTYFGLIRGKTVDFYKDGYGEHKPEMKFTAPGDALEVTTASDQIIVRNKQGLSLYSYEEGSGWTLDPVWHLNLPKDFVALVNMDYGSRIGIFHGDAADFYSAEAGEQPRLVDRFKIPKN